MKEALRTHCYPNWALIRSANRLTDEGINKDVCCSSVMSIRAGYYTFFYMEWVEKYV